MTNKDPDLLLEPLGRSIMVKALIISAVAHVVIIFGTSFGLYADWAAFGVQSPSSIKMKKKELQEQVEEEARRKAAEERAAQVQEAAVAAEGDGSAAGTNAPSGAAPAPAPKAEEKAPVAPEIEPLPPKSGFSLGEDFSI
jgi:sRNA-binding carbon storage regulator CsrA